MNIYVDLTNVNGAGRVVRTSTVAEGIMVDFDADGNPIGVEILDAVRVRASDDLVFEQ